MQLRIALASVSAPSGPNSKAQDEVLGKRKVSGIIQGPKGRDCFVVQRGYGPLGLSSPFALAFPRTASWAVELHTVGVRNVRTPNRKQIVTTTSNDAATAG